MKIAKPTDDDKAKFRRLMEGRSGVKIKSMFGNLAAFMEDNGQMCVGLFGADVGTRLSEADRDALMAMDGAGPFGPEGRPMREYVSLPSDMPDDQANDWILRAIAYAAGLPPKKSKSKSK